MTVNRIGPAPVRIFIACFLTLFAVAGFFGVEAWPLTGWRLFSHARQRLQVSYEFATVGAGGAEGPLPLKRLGAAYSSSPHIAARFDSLSPARRSAACRAWSAASEKLYRDSTEVRIYRVVRDLSMRIGDRGSPPLERRLRYVCRGSSVGLR